jgi:hypothetical protein
MMSSGAGSAHHPRIETPPSPARRKEARKRSDSAPVLALALALALVTVTVTVVVTVAVILIVIGESLHGRGRRIGRATHDLHRVRVRGRDRAAPRDIAETVGAGGELRFVDVGTEANGFLFVGQENGVNSRSEDAVALA